MVTNCLGQMVFPWHFWEILKPNLMAVFHHFFCSSSVCKKLECNLHYSHSKKNYYSRSQGLSTYQSCWGVYKIIMKALATQLHTVMGDIILASQNAFVLNKQILDPVLIANEYLDNRLKFGLPRLLCKLDVEKAFDHVNWGFLMNSLECSSFPNKWRRWIFFCLSTVSFSILNNGSPYGFFKSS